MTDDRPTPIKAAQACGLWRRAGDTSATPTWDWVLNEAVRAYWERRPQRKEAA